MISFKTYLTELFDTEPNFVEKQDQGAYRKYKALIAGQTYTFTVTIIGNVMMFEFIINSNNPWEMFYATELNNPIKVFTVQAWIIKHLANEFPKNTIGFIGEYSRDKLYRKFANKIAKEVGGRVQVIDRKDDALYKYFIIRD